MSEEKKDILGRSWSDICGWLGGQAIPVGARVRVLSDSRQVFHRHFVGLEAVVTEVRPDTSRFRDPTQLRCRFVVPRTDWEHLNYCTLSTERVDIVALGDGQVIGGRDYEFNKLELAEQRFASMDKNYQGYCNAATFLAALYLRADGKHHPAVLGMVKANGRINPTRLANYFSKSNLKIDDWAQFYDGLPERFEFRQRVNWDEVAKEFEDLHKEQAAYA